MVIVINLFIPDLVSEYQQYQDATADDDDEEYEEEDYEDEWSSKEQRHSMIKIDWFIRRNLV